MFIFTDQNFDEEIKEGVVLVKFGAEWCPPCRMLEPIIEKLSEEYSQKAKIGEMDVDKNTAVPERFGIMSIPATKIFVNGELFDEFVGFVPEDFIREKIKSAISKISS